MKERNIKYKHFSEMNEMKEKGKVKDTNKEEEMIEKQSKINETLKKKSGKKEATPKYISQEKMKRKEIYTPTPLRINLLFLSSRNFYFFFFNLFLLFLCFSVLSVFPVF